MPPASVVDKLKLISEQQTQAISEVECTHVIFHCMFLSFFYECHMLARASACTIQKTSKTDKHIGFQSPVLVCFIGHWTFEMTITWW